MDIERATTVESLNEKRGRDCQIYESNQIGWGPKTIRFARAGLYPDLLCFTKAVLQRMPSPYKNNYGNFNRGWHVCNQSLGDRGHWDIWEKKKKVNAEFFSLLKNKTRRLWLDRAWTAEGMIPRGQKRWGNFQSSFNPSQGLTKPFRINPTVMTKLEWKQVFTSCSLMRPLVLPLRISFFSLLICFSSFAILSLSFPFSMSIFSCWIYRDISWWTDC